MQLFLEYIPTAFVQVAMLAVLIVVGFTADKAHIYSEKTARATNDLLFYIITPSVIVNSFLNVELTAENGVGFLTAAAIAVAFHTLLSLIVPLLYRKAGKDQTVFRFGTMYGNVGYMGLPLAQAVAGDMGVFYASAAVAVGSFLRWCSSCSCRASRTLVMTNSSSTMANSRVEMALISGVTRFLVMP